MTRVQQIVQQLDTHSAASVKQALEAAKSLSDLTFEEKSELAKALTEVFYHAHHTGSTLMPKMAVSTEKLIARFGPELLPFLFEEILEADSESVVYFGNTFARQDKAALDFILPQIEAYLENDGVLINLIQVLSYFKTPEAANAIPVILVMAKHSNHQVTATVLYTVGRLIQRLPASAFPQGLRANAFESVFGFLSNPQGLVRKNAARTLGKMLRKGLLSEENERKVYKNFLAITGRDEHHNWDRAFIVRREAEDFLSYFKQATVPVRKYTQSFKIVSKKLLCASTYHYQIEAPLIARKMEAGQFIILRPHDHSERIPLSVCGWNRELGTIEIIVSGVGKTTIEINQMKKGDAFKDVVGPLGERTTMPSSTGTCIVIGGGYGTGAVIPAAREIKSMGNKVIGIVGARNTDALIMVSELKEVCDEVIVTTNDGSSGRQGFVTDALKELLDAENVKYVLAIGPVPMMKAVSEMTRPLSISTYVSLNAIMVDGTGMCGACRVTVGGETKFACFHGPDFDGHKVDFENLMKRQKMFVKEEKLALESIHA